MISLSQPLWLLLLLLALPITAFHTWRRKEVKVGSILLWQQIAQKHRKGARFSRPKASWPLALQLLALCLLSLALAQPHLGRTESKNAVFLLDISGSAARSGGFEASKEALLRDLRRAAIDGQAITVLAVDATPTPIVYAQTRLDGILPLIEPLLPNETTADWPRTKALLKSLFPDEDGTLKLASYGPSAPDFVPTPHTFGEIPIEAYTLRATAEALEGNEILKAPEGGKLLRLFGTLAPNGTSPLPDSLSWAFHPYDGLGNFTPLSPETASSTGTLPLTAKPENTAHFDGTFAFAGPGVVHIYLPDSETGVLLDTRLAPPLKVALATATPEGAFARAAKATFGAVTTSQGPPIDAQSFDLILIDNLPLEAMPEGNVLLFGNAPLKGEAVLSPAESGPLLRESPLPPALSDLSISVLPEAAPLGLAPLGSSFASIDGQSAISGMRTLSGVKLRLAFTSNEMQGAWLVQSLLSFAKWANVGPEAQLSCETGVFCRLPAHLAQREITAPEGTLHGQIFQESGPLPESAGGFVPKFSGIYHLADGRALLVQRPNSTLPDTPREAPAPAPEPALALWFIIGALALLTAELLRAWAKGHRSTLPIALRGLCLAALCAAAFALPFIKPFQEPKVYQTQTSHSLRDTLARAAAALPAESLAHIELKTSGEDPLNDAALALPLLAERGLTLDLIDAPRDPAHSARILQIDTPLTARKGDMIAVPLLIEAKEAEKSLLRLMQNGILISEKPLELSAGRTSLERTILAAREGLLEIGVSLAESPPEIRVINVGPSPKALIVASDTAWGGVLSKALELQGFEASVTSPLRAPLLIDRWLEPDIVILADVAATDFTYQKLEQIEAAVRVHGRSLILLGGAHAFGSGGYFATPLEALSPLSSKVPQDAPEAAVAFLVDRSGSMQAGTGAGSRLDVAREATISAARTLDPKSSVAVIGFDVNAHLMVPLSAGIDEAAMSGALREIVPSGGTALLPALALATEVLSQSTQPLRHMVVMTDGQLEDADFGEAIARATELGITISSIGIGPSAKTRQLMDLASKGGGSFHAARDVRALPSILAQEAMSLSNHAVEEGTRALHWTAPRAALFDGLPLNLPPIDAFVLTTLREGATLHIATTDANGGEVPIMASWQQGAGEVLAFASQGVGGGVASWMQAGDFPRFWAQIARQILPERPPLGLALRAVPYKDTVEISLSRNAAVDESLKTNIIGPAILQVTAPNGEEHKLPLTRDGDLHWRGVLPTDQTGRWQLRAEQAGESESLTLAKSALSRDMPLDDTMPALITLAEATGGRLKDAPSEAASSWTWHLTPTRKPWLLLSVLLLMADLATRYLRPFAARSRS